MVVRLKDGGVARVLVAVGHDLEVETIGYVGYRTRHYVNYKDVTMRGLTDHPENQKT